MRVERLYLSPGHNYFGHKGQPPGTHPLIEVEQMECVAGRGIVGDRFFDYKPDYKGQITFFAWDVLQALLRELQLPTGISPGATRRNVLVSGADLNALVGCDFEVQGVRFVGVEECRPCFWMNEAFRHPQAEEWLKGRGGLRARILTSGILKRDT